jgi:hypothetical protein
MKGSGVAIQEMKTSILESRSFIDKEFRGVVVCILTSIYLQMGTGHAQRFATTPR